MTLIQKLNPFKRIANEVHKRKLTEQLLHSEQYFILAVVGNNLEGGNTMPPDCFMACFAAYLRAHPGMIKEVEAAIKKVQQEAGK